MSGMNRRDFIKWGAGGMAVLATGLPSGRRTGSSGKREECLPNHGPNAKIDPQRLHDVSCRLRNLGISRIREGGQDSEEIPSTRIAAEGSVQKGLQASTTSINPDRIPYPLETDGKKRRRAVETDLLG